MKFYRIHKSTEGGNSAGYEYFTTRRDADKAAKQWIKDNPDEIAGVERLDIKPTRAGLLKWLNIYASHAENG